MRFMTKKIHISAWMIGYALCAGAVVGTWGAVDYFPAKVGNYWLFSYGSSSGGWGSIVVDSGSIKWEIRSIIATKSYPSQVTAMIEQTRNLLRRTFTPGQIITGSPGYDSVYSPPRITRDSLYLHWLEPGNAITRDSDTCSIMAHDPAGALPAGTLIIRDTSVLYGGNSISAKIIDPSPCRGGMQQCDEPNWLITAAGIGPVRYFNRSPSCLMDAYWSETWKLLQTNAGGSAVDQGRRNAYMSIITQRRLNGRIQTFDTRGRRVAAWTTPGKHVACIRIAGNGSFDASEIRAIIK
jgi:hypothetical protein